MCPSFCKCTFVYGVCLFTLMCIIIVASKKQPSIARQLIIATLGGITSLNNNEVSFVIQC